MTKLKSGVTYDVIEIESIDTDPIVHLRLEGVSVIDEITLDALPVQYVLSSPAVAITETWVISAIASDEEEI